MSPTAQLPALTRDELTELAEALAMRLRVLDTYRTLAPTTDQRARLNERIAVCRSLSTAVLEASYHMQHGLPGDPP